jgi:acyl-coenzyme A thioesterase PaaI-like protein
VEFKVNLLAPGKGARFRAMGRVLRAGKTLTVCQGELVALQVGDTDDSPGVVVAVMQATMMAVAPRPA